MNKTGYKELQEGLKEQIYVQTKLRNLATNETTRRYHEGKAAEAAFILHYMNTLHELGRI